MRRPRSDWSATVWDDGLCGEQVMAVSARVLGGKGTIAILAGNTRCPNLQKRVAGVRSRKPRSTPV
jgi:hypothetical protein